MKQAVRGAVRLGLYLAIVALGALAYFRATDPVLQRWSPAWKDSRSNVLRPDASFQSAVASPYRPSTEDRRFLAALRETLAAGKPLDEAGAGKLAALFGRTGFPQNARGVVFALYRPGRPAVRAVATRGPTAADVPRALDGLMAHRKFGGFDAADPSGRVQMDFITEEPSPVAFNALSQTALDSSRFEMGVDGLLVMHGKRRNFYLPGDAFVHSIIGMNQLLRHVRRPFGEAPMEDLRFFRFRTESYVSWGDGWVRLFRGYPVVGPLTPRAVEKAGRAGVWYLIENQREDGRFLYYYEAARDSFRDHEHPERDPKKNPYYNELRHGGGVLLLLYDYRLFRDDAVLAPARRAIDFLLAQAVEYGLPDGRRAAYIYYNRKAKLGGTGIALYALAEYQRLTGDRRYEPKAKLLANHLLEQITASGEFKYYHVYLDKPVTEEENGRLFNFYYPGEAVCGIATYYKYVAAPAEKPAIRKKLVRAMDFLMKERPRRYGAYFTSLPSDSWLMMGINEMWDVPELRRAAWRGFVFQDGDRMARMMYRPEDALYPDYVGALYYNYGDFPYADGARYEGLTAAYELAVKTGDPGRRERYFRALEWAAWAALHLVNTPESAYAVPNPKLAIGGIRFKHTRQWFRVDTIQHVAAFYLKFLPHLERGAAD